MGWTEKTALELLLQKCREYIDTKIHEIINLGENVGGHYVRMFNAERLNNNMGSSFLTVGKFREFLDWLANVFGYYDNKLEEIDRRLDVLEEDANRYLKFYDDAYKDGDLLVIRYVKTSNASAYVIAIDSSSEIAASVEGFTPNQLIVYNGEPNPNGTSDIEKAGRYVSFYGFADPKNAGNTGKLIIRNEEGREIYLTIQCMTADIEFRLTPNASIELWSDGQKHTYGPNMWTFPSASFGNSALLKLKVIHRATIDGVELDGSCVVNVDDFGEGIATLKAADYRYPNYTTMGPDGQMTYRQIEVTVLLLKAFENKRIRIICNHGLYVDTAEYTVNTEQPKELTWSDGSVDKEGNNGVAYATRSDYGTLTYNVIEL